MSYIEANLEETMFKPWLTRIKAVQCLTIIFAPSASITQTSDARGTACACVTYKATICI